MKARALATFAFVLLACGAPPTRDAVREPAAEDTEVAVALRLTDAGPGPAAIPTTEVALVWFAQGGPREVRALGRVQGVCTHERAQGALVQVRCWWAGAGQVLRLARDGDALVVSRIELDEMTGAGSPQLIERVELPPNARLRVIGP